MCQPQPFSRTHGANIFKKTVFPSVFALKFSSFSCNTAAEVIWNDKAGMTNHFKYVIVLVDSVAILLRQEWPGQSLISHGRWFGGFGWSSNYRPLPVL